MAIQPIDLQTLYSQLDKIGKTQIQQQQAAQALRESEQIANRQEAEKKMTTVSDVESEDAKTGVVHEREGSPEQSQERPKGKPREEPEAAEPEEEKKEIITDPTLGKHIDISG
ncbi:MAG TPA: hypothetical protein PKO22_11705 [Treponemataceae bacterium]|nr:hypothetical protein [Treponemataceae bacterium]